jgi:rod shape-determining protein MreD
VNRYGNLLLLGAVVLAQTTVMSSTALGSTRPFLPLLAVVSWVLLRGPVAGLWWALGAGVMLDVVAPGRLSLYSLPLVMAAVAVAGGRGRLFPTNILIPWLMVVVATVTFWLAQRALLPLAGGEVSWRLDVLAREVVPEIALNLLWLPVLYLPLSALARRIAGPTIAWER